MHFKISENIKLISRYAVLVIYDDKSHYPSTYNVLRKNGHMWGEYISAKLGEKILKKRSDLSLLDDTFDLIYCQWNTTEADAVCNLSFLMFSLW